LSYLGTIVTSVFAANALLAYGLGSVPLPDRPRQAPLASALALAIINAMASTFTWAVRSFALSPLGLGSLDILFFVLLALPPIKLLARSAAASGDGIAARVGSVADDLIVGSLVFGVALLTSNGGYTFLEALIGSAASGLGYWLAIALLEAIRERLELSVIPRPFRGAPAMLISAGLMALAFMGIDAAFVKGLAG
jgi:electron transport complex protein RnfA